MTRITCGNCGGTHATVAEVRGCHADPSVTPAARVEPEPEAELPFERTDEARPAAAGPARAAAAIPRLAAAWAGPDALGRNLVVRPGADVPAPWADAPRRVIGAAERADPDDALEALEPCWLARTRFVIEWDGADEPGAPVEARLPWELDPSFTFSAERLGHVVWSNAVDGREPGQARWAWAEAAVAAGATVGGDTDVVLPDGTAAWCDGGPLAPPPEGLTVLHRVALETGRLTPLGRASCRAELAPDQLAAVEHPGGAARIIAPAGSGKTRVLTERARHLLREWKLPTEALTLVAFNVRAAEEMRARTTDLPGLQVRTLNALALAVVNGSGRFRTRAARSTTIDEREVRRLLDDLVRFPRKANTDPSAPWIEALSVARLGLRDPDEVERAFGGDVPGFAEVFPRYRARLAERNALDFDEQIIAAITALLTEPATRAAAQQATRVLLVDEFQDLAPAHLLLLRLLASPELAVFGVGDDDQTIYGYAGATPEWLIGFGRLFPGAGEHPLEVNYRCSVEVVTAADHLLTHNQRRVAKQIHAAPGRAPDPSSLTVVAATDGTNASVEAVLRAIGTGATPDAVAVLARVNSALASVQVALRHHGVPVTSAVDAGYLERAGVRVALAWLRLALDSKRLRATDVDITARRPSRGLSPKVVEWMAGCRTPADVQRLAHRLSAERDRDKVLGYLADVERLATLARQGARTAELLDAVRSQIGLDDAMGTLDRSRADAQSTHIDDLEALVALAALHPNPGGFAEWLREELAAPGDPAGVMLASIHKVKGREWPHVVLHDVREGVMPHRLADDREEERRVFHVGLTRGSASVTVVTDPARPSPYVDEMKAPAPPRPTVDPDPVRRRTLTSASPPASSKGSRDRRAATTTRVGPDDPLRVALREWRAERAKADAVPAYVVFTNVTLDALVEIQPRTLDELRKIPGIGPAKRERYGPGIIEVINS